MSSDIPEIRKNTVMVYYAEAIYITNTYYPHTNHQTQSYKTQQENMLIKHLRIDTKQGFVNIEKCMRYTN